MEKNIILVGCGNMGYAMLQGWLTKKICSPGHLIIIEPNAALRARAAALGVTALASITEKPLLQADLVIFAVKPQILATVAPLYRHFAPAATFLSIVAGASIASLLEMLGSDAAIMRCMPNTPSAIGEGMLVTVANAYVPAEMHSFIAGLLSANGKVTSIQDEALMDAVTALSGSGPAYLFYFIECLAQAGEKVGLAAETARMLAIQTIYGAAALAQESGEDPALLRQQVTSPNGTTAAALGVLMAENGLAPLVEKAVEAARKRSIELSE